MSLPSRRSSWSISMTEAGVGVCRASFRRAGLNAFLLPPGRSLLAAKDLSISIKGRPCAAVGPHWQGAVCCPPSSLGAASVRVDGQAPRHILLMIPRMIAQQGAQAHTLVFIPQLIVQQTRLVRLVRLSNPIAPDSSPMEHQDSSSVSGGATTWTLSSALFLPIRLFPSAAIRDNTRSWTG